jgi:putative spermidine/putrescine transport system substrate-binding protein
MAPASWGEPHNNKKGPHRLEFGGHLHEEPLMKSKTLKHGFYPLVLSMAMGLGSAQAASEMVVVGYGGAGQKAQDVAFFQPFSVVDQSKVIQSEYNGEMAKIKVMVDTGNVDWDVVQIEGPDLMRGCEEGMYERLD